MPGAAGGPPEAHGVVGDGSRPREGVCRGVRISKRRKAEMGGGISG